MGLHSRLHASALPQHAHAHTVPPAPAQSAGGRVCCNRRVRLHLRVCKRFFRRTSDVVDRSVAVALPLEDWETFACRR